jgi:5-methylcytosine-specific restriction endonuclease McrA
MSMLRERVLVLNKSWVPINTVTVESAFRMLFRETASVVCHESYAVFDIFEWMENSKDNGKGIKTANAFISKPEIVLLKGFSKVPNRNLAYTRKNLYRRDDFICQYCYKRFSSGKLTVDHIIPRCRDGASSWENCVLACIDCNSKKGSKSLKEIGYKLKRKPRKPEWSPISDMFGGTPDAWSKFLPNN